MAITHMTPINSLDELLKKMSADKIKNILIGNGFSLSHPELKDCFEWDMHQALCASWNQMIPDKSKGDPEKDLNAIRKKITKCILQFYIDKIQDKLGSTDKNLSDLYKTYKTNMQYNCSNFLRAASLKGGTIFTLNYDPLLYYEMLKLTHKKIHFDGFVTKNDNGQDGCLRKYYNSDNTVKEFLSQNYIACKLKPNSCETIKVFYLHGSWFIQANKDDELRKLDFSSGSQDTLNSLFEGERRPFLILEDRWRTKKAILDADLYFKFCHDQLEEIQGNLLVFGCSFENDQHILNTIINNESLNKIFVTHRTSQDRENLEEKFRSSKLQPQYIQISENVIWEAGVTSFPNYLS